MSVASREAPLSEGWAPQGHGPTQLQTLPPSASVQGTDPHCPLRGSAPQPRFASRASPVGTSQSPGPPRALHSVGGQTGRAYGGRRGLPPQEQAVPVTASATRGFT